jgi:hypothetical protein
MSPMNRWRATTPLFIGVSHEQMESNIVFKFSWFVECKMTRFLRNDNGIFRFYQIITYPTTTPLFIDVPYEHMEEQAPCSLMSPLEKMESNIVFKLWNEK